MKDQRALLVEYEETKRRIAEYMKKHPTGLKDPYVQELGLKLKLLGDRMFDNRYPAEQIVGPGVWRRRK